MTYLEPTNLAVLHNVRASQPCLIERLAGGMDDMTKTILFREDQHRVKKTLHRPRRVN